VPIDSQVVNGRFVGIDHDDPATLEIDQGRILSINGDADVWRTVDASGYFVLPGAIQIGDAAPDAALDLVLQGITCLITPLRCDISVLSDEIDRIDSTTILDVAICWAVPPDAAVEDIRAARRLGVRIFDVRDWRIDREALDEMAGTTVRCPVGSPLLESVLSGISASTIVVTGMSADEIGLVERLTSASESEVVLEVDLPDLLEDDDALWSAVASGHIDITLQPSPDVAMLQSLYAEWVIRRGQGMPGLISALSAAPASVYGLAPSKGKLAIGSDADFLVFDPDQESSIAGTSVMGRVIYSQLRGEILLFNNELHLPPGSGQIR
jgi:hypothetical protein